MENQLRPIEVKRRYTPGRLFKNVFTLATSAIEAKGFKKLSKEETRMVISMISSNLAKYNERNGRPLTNVDIIKIQKEFTEFDAYTFKGESWYSQVKNNLVEKIKHKKLEGRDMKGFVFTPTGVLMLHEEEWEQYKKAKIDNDKDTIEAFEKVITHEGYHFLTNQKNNNMSKIGEKMPSEGSDESFIVKTFENGRFSRVMSASGRTGLAEFNFDSESPYSYSVAVSIMNMLGTMVGINPEVSALKNDGRFIKAVKATYGEDFYKRLIKATNYMLNSEVGNAKKNEALFHMRVQNFVLRTIQKDIAKNSRTPEEALKKLNRFRAAEAWSARIVIIDRHEKLRKLPKAKIKLKPVRKAQIFFYDANNAIKDRLRTIAKKKQTVSPTFKIPVGFKDYYRWACADVEKRFPSLQPVIEKNYLYKGCVFNPMRRIDIKNKENGENLYLQNIREALDFYREYYHVKDKFQVVSKEQYQLYTKIRDQKIEENKKKTAKEPSKLVKDFATRVTAKDEKEYNKLKRRKLLQGDRETTYKPGEIPSPSNKTQSISQSTQQDFVQRLRVPPQAPNIQPRQIPVRQPKPQQKQQPPKKKDDDDGVKFGDF